MGKRKTKTAALHPLDAAGIEALNRAFYASDPGEHLNLRLQHLLRLAAQTDAELRAEQRTYTFGKVTMTLPDTTGKPADEDAHKRLVLIEAEMLLHQTAETLLRLFFAHTTRPDVPWIEMDRLRGPGDFKRLLKDRVLREDKTARLHREAASLFFGSERGAEGIPDKAKADRKDQVDRVVEYLRHFASAVLTREMIYNGAKHGLAIQAGEPSIRIAEIAELSVDGPAISHPKKNKSPSGGREWVVETQWIDLEREFSFIYLGAWLIRSLWLVARIQYVGWPIPDDGQRLPAISVKEVIEAARGAKDTPTIIDAIRACTDHALTTGFGDGPTLGGIGDRRVSCTPERGWSPCISRGIEVLEINLEY